MLILIAMEPLLYGEALADSVSDRRPHLDVQVVEPGMLGSEVERQGPKMVLSSRDGAGISVGVLAWIEYHPYNSPKAAIRIGDQRFEQDVADLADLISVVDRAESLAREA
jgi:hypothetical protein